MTQEAPMKIKALVPYFGAKRNLAPRIVELLGSHRSYWELFSGSAAVLFAKKPSISETIIDLNGDLVNLARVVASGRAHELFDRLFRTAFCEPLFLEARARRKELAQLDPVDLAYDYFVESWMGKNGIAGTRNANTAFCIRFTNGGGDPASRFKSAVDSIPAWAKRLRKVWILQRDAFEIVERIEDEGNTVIYADPPYIGSGSRYIHDFKPEDHDCLAELLHRFKKARVVLSYYDHPKLGELYPDWWREEIQISKVLAHQVRRGENDMKATEVLLCNQPIEAKEQSLFE